MMRIVVIFLGVVLLGFGCGPSQPEPPVEEKVAVEEEPMGEPSLQEPTEEMKEEPAKEAEEAKE